MSVETVPSPEYKLLFGYRHVSGVPLCPCRDPGNYLMAEQRVDDPLSVRFTCWCGRTVTGRCDDQAELDALLKQNGVDRV